MLEKNTERLQELTEEGGGGGPSGSGGEGAAAGQEDNRIQVHMHVYTPYARVYMSYMCLLISVYID